MLLIENVHLFTIVFCTLAQDDVVIPETLGLNSHVPMITLDVRPHRQKPYQHYIDIANCNITIV